MTDKSWLWPQRPHNDTTTAIRIGRVIHWVCIILALAVAIFGALVLLQTPIGPAFVVNLLPTVVGSLGLALVGRALRWIIANE